MRNSALLLAALTVACVDIAIDPGETVNHLPEHDGPTVEFDPGAGVLPLPNNAALNPTTGRVALPARCGETEAGRALREDVLNTLDGFALFKGALRITLSEPADLVSLQNSIRLFRRATGTVLVNPANAVEVPVVLLPETITRSSADCTRTTIVDSILVVPTVPLEGGSTYVAVVTADIRTATGQDFLPSGSWALIRQEENPVTMNSSGEILADRTSLSPSIPEEYEALVAIDRLWRLHAPGLTFVTTAMGLLRSDVLLEWEFTTQSTTTPLDPTLPGSPAASASALPLQSWSSIPASAGVNAETYLVGILGSDACLVAGCDQVGDILAGRLVSPNFQTSTTNPLAGGAMVPGPWSDPVTPTRIGDKSLTAIAFVPAGGAPLGGYPTIVFGHGMTLDKTTLFAIGAQLAGRGFASVAIDWVNHGDRAVRTSSDASKGCSGSPTLVEKPQCFASFLSADLATSRDDFRQSALDALALIKGLKACTGSNCGALEVDGNNLGYLGMSLGSLVGTIVVGVSPDIKAAVFNVGGVGLMDLVEHTATVEVRCGVVDTLIAAGVITGELLNPLANPPTGTCLGDDWRTQPGYLQFAAAARWVLDPAEGGNFVPGLAGIPVFLQEVAGDDFVPNYTTAQLGAQLGLTPASARFNEIPATPPASSGVPDTGASAWLRYTTSPGNRYQHSSLINADTDGDGSSDDNLDGQLATLQMQTDAITFLFRNLTPN
jgi:hypothetical protein